MTWTVRFHDEFETDFAALDPVVKRALVAHLRWIAIAGPRAGRPRADTLKGSKFSNMKELRFAAAGGEWRFAFAFDPSREAVVLAGGDKSGGGEARFYEKLIAKADGRFQRHLRSAAQE